MLLKASFGAYALCVPRADTVAQTARKCRQKVTFRLCRLAISLALLAQTCSELSAYSAPAYSPSKALFGACALSMQQAGISACSAYKCRQKVTFRLCRLASSLALAQCTLFCGIHVMLAHSWYCVFRSIQMLSELRQSRLKSNVNEI